MAIQRTKVTGVRRANPFARAEALFSAKVERQLGRLATGHHDGQVELPADDLDDSTLVAAIDRFLVYYVRTGERLERTSTWVERMGLDHIRQVILEDRLGLGEELEAAMQERVDAYECEWKATLDDPERLERFVSFVNAPGEPDPTIVFVRERGQIRPATADERVSAGLVGAVR